MLSVCLKSVEYNPEQFSICPTYLSFPLLSLWEEKLVFEERNNV